MSIKHCECGWSYVPEYDQDAADHARIHEEYLTGPVIPSLQSAEFVGLCADFRVMRGGVNTPAAVRKEMAAVAYKAHLETPDYKAGYDGSAGEGIPVLYVAADELRAVAMVLVGETDRSWLLRWSASNRACLRSRVPSVDTRPVIGRVWVAASYRRHHLATNLIGFLASDVYRRPMPEFCWQLPLSPSGLALVKCMAPRDWMGDGDSFDMEGLLSEPCDCDEAERDG